MTLLANDRQIETDRLILRRVEREDLPFFTRIHADPDVARYLGHGNPRTADESASWMDSLLASYEALQLGQIAITLKKDASLIGRSGVSDLEVETTPGPDGRKTCYFFPLRAPDGTARDNQLELGYTLDKSAWSNGYAREAVAAVYAYVRRTRPGAEVVSLIRPENDRSKRVAQSFGVTYVDQVTGWGHPFDRYRWR
jgi:ribosomal-protein-alanine N-acetyltransferase